MLHKKLLEVIKLLKQPQRQQFRLFLQSPYFNRGGNALELLRLYDHIISFHADEHQPHLSKLFVSEMFFPEKAFFPGQKGPIDALTSDLFKLAKRFLAQQSFEHNDLNYEEDVAMAKFYRKFGMEERFRQTIEALRKGQELSPYRDATFFQKQYVIEEETASFEGLINKFEDDANLLQAEQYLDLAYVINKTDILCALSYQQRLTQNINFNFSAVLTQAVINLPIDYQRPLQYEINLIILQLIQDTENVQKITLFEALLLQHSNEIPFEKLKNYMAFYRFFLNRMYVSSGTASIRNKIFSTYKAHFEQGYFYEGEEIMLNSLKVLVSLGLRHKEFDWVKKVLTEHPPSRICGTKYPVEAHNLCFAEYYFYKKEYQTALDTLIYKHFENTNISILAEIILIKTYFETKDELLEYRIKAMEQKVRRAKVSTETKQRYNRFLQVLSKIVKHGYRKNNPKLQKLKEDAKTAPGIIEREWLLEKLNENEAQRG